MSTQKRQSKLDRERARMLLEIRRSLQDTRAMLIVILNSQDPTWPFWPSRASVRRGKPRWSRPRKGTE